jgi:hypothetical protein
MPSSRASFVGKAPRRAATLQAHRTELAVDPDAVPDLEEQKRRERPRFQTRKQAGTSSGSTRKSGGRSSRSNAF